IGLLTVACARAVGADGTVYAFEPEPAMHAALAETLKLNGLSWVNLRAEAVGRKAGLATFYVSPVPGHSSLYPLPAEEASQGEDLTVRIVRLDDVIPRGGRLDVIKIDVEGAELDVLAGAARTLAENPDMAIVVEFGPSHLRRTGITPEAWFEAFTEHGLYAQEILEPWGHVRPVDMRAIQAVESANLVFVRPKGAAEARLAS
ncbi:FkbM family methyltransferase, partial [uncultured Phenylobacterium sp.]|uniref:FkbM family methyltransferase n=1 Tax=uncultured Phenylobacterium sp. TaxID=349273 RepID=UPI0025CBBE4F